MPERINHALEDWANTMRIISGKPPKPKLSPEVQNSIDMMRFAAGLDENGKPIKKPDITSNT